MESGWLTSIRKIDYKRQLAVSFIFGIIFTTLITPIATPPIQDAQAGSILVPAPEPEIAVQYSNSSPTGYITNHTDVDLDESRYRIYFVTVSNPTHKLITDLNVAVFFSGCPTTVDVQFSNLDAAFLSRSSDEIETGQMLNQDCAATLDIEELPPERKARFFIVVDTKAVNTNLAEEDRLPPFEIAVYGNYEWQMNGRLYHQSFEYTQKVEDELTAGEVILRT